MGYILGYILSKGNPYSDQLFLVNVNWTLYTEILGQFAGMSTVVRQLEGTIFEEVAISDREMDTVHAW